MLRDPSSPTHRRGWLLAEGGRRTVARVRADLRALPARAWRSWLWSIAAALVPGLALSVGLCFLAKWMVQTGRLAWEPHFLRRLEAGPMSFSAALWAESPGNSVFMIPVVIAAALLAVWLRRPVMAGAILSSFFILDLLVAAGWLAWSRARPDLIAGGIAAPGFNSFPSGHASQMVSAYGFFVFLWIRSSRSVVERVLAVVLWLGATLVVGWARMRLGAHWPSDIAAGVLVGAFWLAASITALRRAEALGAR
jgi:undecaprenyl-diphosphatase